MNCSNSCYVYLVFRLMLFRKWKPPWLPLSLPLLALSHCNIFYAACLLCFAHVFGVIKSAYDRFTQQSSMLDALKLTECGADRVSASEIVWLVLNPELVYIRDSRAVLVIHHIRDGLQPSSWATASSSFRKTFNVCLKTTATTTKINIYACGHFSQCSVQVKCNERVNAMRGD